MISRMNNVLTLIALVLLAVALWMYLHDRGGSDDDRYSGKHDEEDDDGQSSTGL